MLTKDIDQAILSLDKEDVVVIPTETVYGLAGNAFSEHAVRKIFELKKRPLNNPLILHVSELQKVYALTKEFPKKAKVLASKFWPGPLTLLLPKKDIIPDLITAGKKTVAIRIPNHALTLSLLEKLNYPLVAPSANPFNEISPTNANHVMKYFKNEEKIILDGGQCEMGLESTIIGFDEEEVIIYRLGAITLEEIESVIGKVTLRNVKMKDPNAPGMFLKHYAPKTKAILTSNVEEFIVQSSDKKIGVIRFDKPSDDNLSDRVIVEMTFNGSMKEASQKLYDYMHYLDDLNLDVLVFEKLPDIGLGKTINDKLFRATS